jgi:glycosyltransferase involved in cell wall biosynthesis
MIAEKQNKTTQSSEDTAGSVAAGSADLQMLQPESLKKPIHVAVLTAGRDKPYALGMGTALIEQGIITDFIGSDDVDAPNLHGTPLVNFLNLRGDQSVNAGALKKMIRVLAYYRRLLAYAVTARPKVFHILWHNKFDFLDRTLVMGFYKLLGKRLVFTAHNVNAGKRDGRDTLWNRISLKSEYRLADHILVHTGMMKQELMREFRVIESKITVIPFGINNTLPTSGLTKAEARQRLGIAPSDKTILFFGNIAPYKGVEFLARAFARLARKDGNYRLVIAGRPKGSEEYWTSIRDEMEQAGIRDRVIEKIEFIPDEDVEIYFKAADLLVLPYTLIFQSGVLFLGYSFGLPVLAADVGSLKEEIVPGKTGLVCRPQDSDDLAKTIEAYFESDLYRELEQRRPEIRRFANERYSWTRVGEITKLVYARLLKQN